MFKNIRQELSDARGGGGGGGNTWESGFWKWRKSMWVKYSVGRCDTAAEKIGRTPGLEEYIEGLSFMWYLQHGGLVSLDDVQKALSDENGEPVRVIPRPTQSSPSAIG